MSIFAPYLIRLRSTIGLMPLTTDQKIGGSNPSGVTKRNCLKKQFLFLFLRTYGYRKLLEYTLLHRLRRCLTFVAPACMFLTSGAFYASVFLNVRFLAALYGKTSFLEHIAGLWRSLATLGMTAPWWKKREGYKAAAPPCIPPPPLSAAATSFRRSDSD